MPRTSNFSGNDSNNRRRAVSSTSKMNGSSSSGSHNGGEVLQSPVSYFSKLSSGGRRPLRTNDLPYEAGAVGLYSKYGVIWSLIFAIVPVAYIYIFLIVLRELCDGFPDTVYYLFKAYVPPVASMVNMMREQSSTAVELWCIVEALFFVSLKIYIRYLENLDPLEASLSSAPFMKPEQREILWKRMMEVEKKDPAGWLSGWFFDQPIKNISRRDVFSFLTWSLFEGRNQEHLTRDEMNQLESFVQQLELKISIQWYGVDQDLAENKEDDDDDFDLPGEKYNQQGTGCIDDKRKDDLTQAKEKDAGAGRDVASVGSVDADDRKMTEEPTRIDKQNTDNKPQAEKPEPDDFGRSRVPLIMFRFPELKEETPPDFFSNLYESYRQSYEKYRSMMDDPDFHPVEDAWNFMANTTQHIVEADPTHVSSQVYENIIQPVGETQRRISARLSSKLTHIGTAAEERYNQMYAAFQNAKEGMMERLETAKFLSSQRKAIRKRLKGYRETLDRLREIGTEVPAAQIALLMRRITDDNKALERLERSAYDAFVKTTGYARRSSMFFNPQEPQRFAKYSGDPLLGVATFPLGFHILILAATEIPLRRKMAARGFERRSIGKVSYYFHPGVPLEDEPDIDDDDDDDDHYSNVRTPIVFVHGIGIGLIVYMHLVDELLKTGRPIFLPEIPYVSGFRFWQGPNCVLPPAVVCSTLTAMLATHGYLRGTFSGHSYGTSWVSYMCKYAPKVVAALLFLDPICFCLHVPRLTKKFVYHRPDPGTISYIVRTDLVINWTIQRSFPWAWIILFAEQINVPCCVFLSDQDALVPAEKVEKYLESRGAPLADFRPGLGKEHFASQDGLINVCVFRGHGHGDWTDVSDPVPSITASLVVLCERAEAKPGGSDILK